MCSIGSRTFSRLDAVAAASLRGEWPAIEDHVRLEVACASAADDEDDAPEIDVSKLADAFRYARQLLTAEETEAWLERSGLTLDSWSDQLERTELSRVWKGRAADILGANTVSDDDLAEALYPALVCSGALERFVWTLAERAAACADAGIDLDADAAVPDAAVAAEASRAVRLVRGSDDDDDGEETTEFPERCIADLQHIERGFQRLVQAERTPAALALRLDAHRMDWIRVAWRALAFATEAAAREAALRIRTDGESPAAVAADLAVTLHAQQSFLGDVDEWLRAALFSARTGELAGPLTGADQFHLILLDEKIPPALDDPDVRRRAEADVAQALLARGRKHIHWHERL